MKIGLLGLAFGSTNKGCEALGYGFLNILELIAKKNDTKIEVVLFYNYDTSIIHNNGKFVRLKFSVNCLPGIGSLTHIKAHITAYRRCDYVFDFTAGDSFSDIYGMERFIRRTVVKNLVIMSKTPLILGSQTYGPYKSALARRYVKYILKKSKKVFARDDLSVNIVKTVSGIDAVRTVDVAFAMGYQREQLDSNKINIGFNPSGLLWQGGYNQSNQFGLTVDYQSYCCQVMEKLLKDSKNTIYLVAHVLSDNLEEIDNDIVACKALMTKYPQLKMAPKFDTPVEAKSFISGLDIFTGARMHATIAAFTTGVPVVPFSYSPKFEGLFHSLGYKYVISGCKATTESAVSSTLELISDCETLETELKELRTIIKQGIDYLIEETTNAIFGD